MENTLKQSRREGALARLEKQLESGVKPIKKNLTETTSLTEKDIKRIKEEIKILERRIL